MCHSLMAQLTVVAGSSMGITPEQLVQEYLVGKGVTISNVTLNGSPGIISKNHIGYFHAAGGAFSQLKMESGIIMTTGSANYAVGPNKDPGMGVWSNTGSDPDLEELTGSTAYDACIIEFDFVPQCDTLRFRYAFGSEEFYEFCGHNINDAFGFFLSGPGIHGTFSNNSINLALMPGSSEFVTIQNICPDSSVAWNNQSGSFLQYDAMTWVLSAWHEVVPFQLYHMKLVIGDAVDKSFDSGVFLEKGSFSAGFEFNISNVPSTPQAGPEAVEGCNDIAVWFVLPKPAQTELQIDFNIGGTATSGADFAPLSNSVLIQPGHNSAAVIIHPLFDGITEGPETVILEILKKTCHGMMLLSDTITILDNSPLSVSAGNDMTLCPGDSVLLIASTTGGFGPFLYFWNYCPANDSMIIVRPDLQGNRITVVVTDRCGIHLSDSLMIRIEPVALLTNQPVSKVICSGDTTGIMLTSNISRALFSWEPEEVSGSVSGFAAGNGKTINHALYLNDRIPGIVNYRIRVAGNGCDTSNTDYKITVNPLPDPDLGETVFIDPGSAVELNPGGGYAEYLWSNESSDSGIMVHLGGVYWVRVKNQYGCYNSDSIVVNEFGLNIPNAFSPNGDGLNDCFRVNGFEYQEKVVMQIFNRWGNLIFETQDLDKGWDGTAAGTQCPADTYIWIINFRSEHDSVFKGTVTIVL